MSERNRRKPLYTGDSSATMTICSKKLRRHFESDIQVVIMPALQSDTVDWNGDKYSEEAIQRAGLDKPTYWPVCRHCKEDPFIRVVDESLSRQ